MPIYIKYKIRRKCKYLHNKVSIFDMWLIKQPYVGMYQMNNSVIEAQYCLGVPRIDCTCRQKTTTKRCRFLWTASRSPYKYIGTDKAYNLNQKPCIDETLPRRNTTNEYNTRHLKCKTNTSTHVWKESRHRAKQSLRKWGMATQIIGLS